MGAYKNLTKNAALFLFMGAIPSLGWASGFFSPFSLTSVFLIGGAIFCALWLKSRSTHQHMRKLLLTRGEAWAICEGQEIVDRSPSFPAENLESFKTFLRPRFHPQFETALHKLFFEGQAFQIRVQAAESDAYYSLEAEPIEDSTVFWLKNVTDTVRQEQAYNQVLQRSERLFSALQKAMDLMPFPVWHRDAHQRITFCNKAYAKAVQSSPARIFEEGIELIHPRFAKILARKAINTGEGQSFESAAIADGERRHFRICELPKSGDEGTLGLALEISELEEARSEIKRLIGAHDEVLDHLSTAVCVYDSAGILQYYNQAYVKISDFEEEFLKTHPGLDEVLEDLRSRRQLEEFANFPAYKKQRLQNLKEQLSPQEELMHLPDERTIRIFSAPHPMGGLLFTFEDVTDFLTLERRNKSFLDAYQATLDNLFEGVVVIGSDYRIKIFNPSFVRLWNFKEGEVKADQHFTHIVDKLKDYLSYKENWEDYKAQFIEVIATRVPKTGQLKRSDGSIITFSYVPLPNGDHLLSYTEATEGSHGQDSLMEHNKNRGLSGSLKSEFIANVSSKLKSPLNTIIGFSEVLSQQYFGPLNERQIDYVKGVLDSSHKLLHLVNDVLDLASLEAGYLKLQCHHVDVYRLMKDAHDLVIKRVQANQQTLVLECDETIGKWSFDERRLRQALFNLLSNAIKYTPTTGKVVMRARIKNDELELAVADTGIGIAMNDQKMFFKKFERGSETGAGLGLSLVKNIIELHGGRIHLHSEPQKGTTVTCFLPREASQPKQDEEEEIAQASLG